MKELLESSTIFKMTGPRFEWSETELHQFVDIKFLEIGMTFLCDNEMKSKQYAKGIPILRLLGEWKGNHT